VNGQFGREEKYMRRYNIGRRIFDTFNTILLIAIATSMVYPFIHLLAVALSIPKGFTFNTFEQIMKSSTMKRTMGNTIYLTIMGTAVNMILTIIMAYPLSRKYIIIRGFLMKMMLFTMLFN
jgi:ABC-type glycerol-3-phosphate transport system permease component